MRETDMKKYFYVIRRNVREQCPNVISVDDGLSIHWPPNKSMKFSEQEKCQDNDHTCYVVHLVLKLGSNDGDVVHFTLPSNLLELNLIFKIGDQKWVENLPEFFVDQLGSLVAHVGSKFHVLTQGR